MYKQQGLILHLMFTHCMGIHFGNPDELYEPSRGNKVDGLLGGGRQSPQFAPSRPNRTGPRGTVQKRTRPTFERQSSQFLCLYDCPSRFVARTSRSLDLKARFRGVSYDSRKRAFIKTPKLEAAITRRASLRFR